MQLNDQAVYRVKDAARRANRSTRTIERWIRDGLQCRLIDGLLVIEHADLIAEMVKRNRSNPNMRGRFDTT